MDPQWIIAACAGAGLLITWTTSTLGAAVWIIRRIDSMKADILEDIKAKHEENRIRVDALQRLVIRHETLLEPEFNGSSNIVRRASQ